MANAKKCDRCGTYYQLVEMDAVELAVSVLRDAFTKKNVLAQIRAIEANLDLCPSCSESLKRWAFMKEQEEGADNG